LLFVTPCCLVECYCYKPTWRLNLQGSRVFRLEDGGSTVSFSICLPNFRA